jgi:GTP diphosphokinase / guanosine-3',5'-bis(diphosphate) 3'-diphosphatase
VRWDIEESRHELFPARILVTAINEPGTLGQIATVIGDHGANIDNIVIKPLSADFREMTIDVEVTDLKHLNTIISHLRARPVVSKVERVNG